MLSKSSGLSPLRQESLSRMPQTVIPAQRDTCRHALTVLAYADDEACAMSSSVNSINTARNLQIKWQDAAGT